jgi:hypothetical protein
LDTADLFGMEEGFGFSVLPCSLLARWLVGNIQLCLAACVFTVPRKCSQPNACKRQHSQALLEDIFDL